MTRDEAAKILGIVELREAAVSKAYRELSKGCHPNGQTPDAVLWERLSAARAALMAPPPRCTACRGTGRVRAGALFTFCQECRGKGYA